jgi:tetratricopeptide (TPR) repeat protein
MTALRINQKAFGSAADLTLEAEEICAAIGERQSLVAAMMQRAITFHYRGDPEAVLPILDRAIALLGPDDDPDLLLVARLNRAHAYVSIDRSARALAEFRAARNTDRGHGRPALRLRTHWQEALLLGELGRLEAAAEMLCAVRRGFLERNLAPDMVAASRDLASLYRRMGKRTELEETVLETQALFFGIPAEAEVLASLRELERMAVA